MSGILGVWNARGGPVAPEVIARMADALSHLGPDGCQTAHAAAAAFAVQAMWITPESVGEKQPWTTERGTVVVFDGRLDNRVEVASAMHPSLSSVTTDVELVAAVYESYGQAAVERLLGDFALAIFEPQDQSLLLARDAMGARPLYFTRIGDLNLFASEIKALLAHPGVPCRPNEKALAEFVLGNLDPSDETATFFAGIHRVAPGSFVRITPSGVKTHRYFDFDTIRCLHLRHHREYVAAYREAFARAVSRRLRSVSPTGLLVSGGLDSSAICCMAYELQRADSGKYSSLLPLGLVADASVPGGKDASEWDFQRAVEEKCAADIVRVPLRSFAAAAEGERKVRHAEGPWILENAYADLYREARQRGVRVVLSGIFGDNLLMSPQFLADLIRQGRWVAAWNTYRSMQRKPWYVFDGATNNAVALRQYLWRELRGYLVPGLVLSLSRRFRTQREPAAAKYYAHSFARLAAGTRENRPPKGRAHAQALYRAAGSTLLALRAELDAKAAAMCGVQISYPYRDRELVQLVMSMPGEEVYAGGDSRGLHREAMAGVLPEAVRQRRTKADFTEFARSGLLEDLPVLPDPVRGAAAIRGWLGPDFEERFALLVQTLRSGPQLTKDLNDAVSNLLNMEVMTKVFFRDRSGGDKIRGTNSPRELSLMTLNDRSRLTPQPSSKKTYQTPKLSCFGGFQHLTMGGGGIRNDGARVNTKA